MLGRGKTKRGRLGVCRVGVFLLLLGVPARVTESGETARAAQLNNLGPAVAQLERDDSLCEKIVGVVNLGRADVSTYVVKKGDSLISIAKRTRSTVRVVGCLNPQITSVNHVLVGELLLILKWKPRVIVDTRKQALTIALGDLIVKEYAVGIGMGGKFATPRGTFKIGNKVWNPYDAEHKADAGHPMNQFGHVWIALNVRGYGIHGTNVSETLGPQTTKGCLLMSNRDAGELGELLPFGTSVAIN